MRLIFPWLFRIPRVITINILCCFPHVEGMGDGLELYRSSERSCFHYGYSSAPASAQGLSGKGALPCATESVVWQDQEWSMERKEACGTPRTKFSILTVHEQPWRLITHSDLLHVEAQLWILGLLEVLYKGGSLRRPLTTLFLMLLWLFIDCKNFHKMFSFPLMKTHLCVGKRKIIIMW